MSTDASTPRFSDKQHDDMYKTLVDLEEQVMEITNREVQSEAEVKLQSAKLKWEKSLVMSCLARAHTLLAQIELEIAGTELNSDVENVKSKIPADNNGGTGEKSPRPRTVIIEDGPAPREAKRMCNENLSTIYERPCSSSSLSDFTGPQRDLNVERFCSSSRNETSAESKKAEIQGTGNQKRSRQKKCLSRKTARKDSQLQPINEVSSSPLNF